ncbi:predicted protein [Uncinocarpus reesii 1704]|uniref:Uncharacterized protein n=1 Tax=Uncinocarpus reesii (strain UAMH 1704) TaxID=336963 RepID=C4JYM7_UNCRE|nr:uncharacterized protein UREG_07278 [Uncinocarpus reesii 1704]EEP82413.1 predicted protein [Uncinocarpus reesii 1704]
MAMKYFKTIRDKAPFGKSPAKAHDPILTEEDEAFLSCVANSPEKTRVDPGGDAQIALMDGAQNIPLPMSPREEEQDLDQMFAVEGRKSRTVEEEREEDGEGKVVEEPRKGERWSWILGNGKGEKDKAKKEPPPMIDQEVQKEEEDISEVLEKLNLAAINNRVFSIGDETQELLEKFKFVFKDLVNGVPTAYNDLETLLTSGDKQLQSTFDRLPEFLRKLIEQLPTKVTERFAPEMLAVAAERAGRHGLNAENAGKAAGAAKKMGFKVPSLKEVVGKPAAIAGMLRSIMTFLRARFPALMGMNVFWSLALTVLLIVLWYCHKRGREERLEKERISREASASNLDDMAESTQASPIHTTSADNAPIGTAQTAGNGAQQHPAQYAPVSSEGAGMNSSVRAASNMETRRKTVEPYKL